MDVQKTPSFGVLVAILIIAGLMMTSGHAQAAGPVFDNTVVPSMSSGSSVFGGGGVDASVSSSGSSSTSLSGSPSISSQVVPYDLKSASNPSWNMFLEEVAQQTSRNLADLQMSAVNDPIIGAMWDVYIQTLSDLSALPSGGGGLTSSSGASRTSNRGGGSAVDGPRMSLYEGSTQRQSGAATYVGSSAVQNNWFKPFFRSPESEVNSYTAPKSSTSTLQQQQQASSTNTAGSTYNMDQMFSMFRLPSSASSFSSSSPSVNNQPREPLAYSSQNRHSLFTSLTSMALTALGTSAAEQTSFNRLPDSGWSSPSGSTAASSLTRGELSPEQIEQLSNELLQLLGKSLIETHSTNSSKPSASPSLSTSVASTEPKLSTSTQPQPPPVVQTPTLQPQPQPPPVVQTQTLQPQTQPSPVVQTQTLQSQTQPSLVVQTQTLQAQPKMQSVSVPNSLTLFMNAAKVTNTPVSYSRVQYSPGLAGLAPSLMPPPVDMIKPVLNIYNANFNAGASRELGCKTLAEMLDMDVPRPLDLSCNSLCPALMPGAVTGKRFGLTCLCCPYYVSDQAIESRSMVRQVESLT